MITLDHELCFTDCETLGLDREAPIWEVAAIRLRADGTRDEYHAMVLHHPGNWVDFLPEVFADDYRRRFDLQLAVPGAQAAREIRAFTDGAIIAGSNPSFDMDRLALLMRKYGVPAPGWHFHPLDIPSMVVGCEAGIGLDLSKTPRNAELEWNSSRLSSHVGVNPANYARHTALGDVLWTLAQWDAMEGGPW